MTRVWQSLVILTVSAAMLAEAITAKTQMAETGVLTVAVLFLIPLGFAPSLTHIVRDGHFWRAILPLLLLAALYLLHPLLLEPLVPDRGADPFRAPAYIGMMCLAFASGAAIARSGQGGNGLFALLIVLALLGAAWAYRFNLDADAGFALTKNTVSGLVAHFVILALLLSSGRSDRRWATGIGLLVLAIALFINHRILGLAALAFLLVYHLTAWARLGRVAVTMLVAVNGLAAYPAIIIVSGLPHASGIADLNALFVDLTGRRLTSGREEHWAQILYFVQMRPWLGLGPAVLPRDLFATDLASAHNSFLTIALQVGLAGVALVAWQLLSLARSFGATQNKKAGALGVGYLCFVIVHANFESFLTANNFPIAAIVWLNLGLLWGWARQVSPERTPRLSVANLALPG